MAAHVTSTGDDDDDDNTDDDLFVPVRTEAWQCDGRSPQELAANLRSAGAFRAARVGRALAAVDRRDFVRFADFAYVDAPQKMGDGWSISAPHLHANALQVLAPKLVPGARCLDVGCGSGYMTAAMGWLVAGEPADLVRAASPLHGDSGRCGCAVGIDIVPDAITLAAEIIGRSYPALSHAVHFHVADGWEVSLSSSSPLSSSLPPSSSPSSSPTSSAAAPAALAPVPRLLFDVIHVGAAVEDGTGIPEPLLAQLALGGRMCISIGGVLLQIDKLPDAAAGSKKTTATVVYEGAGFTPLHRSS